MQVVDCLLEGFRAFLDALHRSDERLVRKVGAEERLNRPALTGVEVGDVVSRDDTLAPMLADLPWVKVAVFVLGFQLCNSALQSLRLASPVVWAIGV